MADNRSAFLKRVISAVLAGILLLGVAIYGGRRGVDLIILLAIVLASREFVRMAFGNWLNGLSVSFFLSGALCYFGVRDHMEHAMEWFAASAILFLVLGLWLSRSKFENENLLRHLTLGLFGLVYCVLFPTYAAKLIYLVDGEGMQWFLFLLLVVFFGDIFAYFGGRWFGRQKFMPMISPNKTWQGSIGGLLGSSFAGTVHVASTFPNIEIWKTVVFCLLCGAAAQTGDLLISLVKRVAQVKDTGTIMPGHGGILDRLDGVFIACPLVYAFATWNYLV